MAIKRIGQYWHMHFSERGTEVRRTTGIKNSGKDSKREAQRYEDLVKEQIRKAALFGERPEYSFLQAVDKYMDWKQDKKTLSDDANRLMQMSPFLKNAPLHLIHAQHKGLIQFLESKRNRSPRTRNHYRLLIKSILRLAHEEWVDTGTGKTWLPFVPTPIIKMERLNFHNQKRAYPLTWTEQVALLNALPCKYRAIVLFALNTGARELEYCRLAWEYEDKANGVFWLPETKNGSPRPVVLNSFARSVIDGQRGLDERWVFTIDGRPLSRLNNRAWRTAWAESGLPVQENIMHGPHNLRHTFSTRLANMDVSPKIKDWLMGHADRTVGDSYTIPMIESMRGSVERLCKDEIREMTPLRLVGRNK